MSKKYPLGKLPYEALADLLGAYTIPDPRVLLGPRPGEDAAVIDMGNDTCLVTKTDPITFTTDEIGWYVVNINANDIAVTGAVPYWFMVTLLLPGGKTTPELVKSVFSQIVSACDHLGVSLVGGHTEITYGIDRPIAVGTMIGTASADRVISTAGAQVGDILLLTKGYPIEGAAIIAREKQDCLLPSLARSVIETCAGYLHNPGISVVRDAALAIQSGRIHAMHDPTEGGVATSLWELAIASDVQLVVNLDDSALVDGLKICEAVGVDPVGALASGALLMAVHPADVQTIADVLRAEEIMVFEIGRVTNGPVGVYLENGLKLVYPDRDEIARLFE